MCLFLDYKLQVALLVFWLILDVYVCFLFLLALSFSEVYESKPKEDTASQCRVTKCVCVLQEFHLVRSRA